MALPPDPQPLLQASRKRMRRIIVASIAVILAGIALRLAMTGAIQRWQASRMPNAALRQAAARPHAPFAVVYELARRLERSGDFPPAAKAYQRAAAINPVASEAWTGWARCEFARGNWAVSERVLRKTIELWPHKTEAHFILAAILDETFRREAAKDELMAGLAINPSRREAWLALGRLEMLLGHPDAAVRAFSRAQSMDPRSSALHGPFGAALLAAGRVAEARKELEAALRADPSDLEARLQLARALLTTRQGPDRVRGMQELTRVAEFAANKAPAYIEAARVWLSEGNRGDAGQALEHAVDANPYSVEALTMLRDFYQQSGRNAEARAIGQRLAPLAKWSAEREIVLRAIEKGEDVPGNLLRLGDLDISLGNPSEGRKAFVAALSMDPGNQRAIARLKQQTATTATAPQVTKNKAPAAKQP
ncbi:MAG: tetratricopeptide repeat protein [Chthonomonadales bacterium]